MITRGPASLALAALALAALGGCGQEAEGASSPAAASSTRTTTPATPAAEPSRPTSTVYGFARADGPGTMIISPRRATRDKNRYRVEAIRSAGDVRVTFAPSLDYRRITVACDLKETEGKIAIDAKALGATRCAANDLDFTLSLGPVPVRVTYDPASGAAVQAQEFLYPPDDPRTAFGTIAPAGKGAVQFTPYAVKRVPSMGYSFTKKSGEPITLPYTGTMIFFRVGRSCGDNSVQPTSTDRDGIGMRQCSSTDLAGALGALKEMQVKVDYLAASGEVMEIHEVYPCQGDICG